MWDLTTAIDLHTRMSALGLNSISNVSEAYKSPSTNSNISGASLGILSIALNNLQMHRQYFEILQVFFLNFKLYFYINLGSNT